MALFKNMMSKISKFGKKAAKEFDHFNYIHLPNDKIIDKAWGVLGDKRRREIKSVLNFANNGAAYTGKYNTVDIERFLDHYTQNRNKYNTTSINSTRKVRNAYKEFQNMTGYENSIDVFKELDKKRKTNGVSKKAFDKDMQSYYSGDLSIKELRDKYDKDILGDRKSKLKEVGMIPEEVYKDAKTTKELDRAIKKYEKKHIQQNISDDNMMNFINSNKSQNINTTPKATPKTVSESVPVPKEILDMHISNFNEQTKSFAVQTPVTTKKPELLNVISQEAAMTQEVQNINNIGAPEPKPESNSRRNVSKINNEAKEAQQQAQSQNIKPNNSSSSQTNTKKQTKNSSQSASKFLENYKNMSNEELKAFQDGVRNKYKPIQTIKEISAENSILNAQTLISNQDMLKTFSNEEINPIKKVDINLSKEIESALEKEISNTREYFSNINNELFDKNGKIKDFEAYGDIVNILSDENVPKSVKKVFEGELSLDGNLLGEEISKGQKRDFIEKTFKGDATNEDDVNAYMEKVKTFLNSDNEEIYEDFQSLIEKEGNILKKRNEKKEASIKRQAEKQKELERKRIEREKLIEKEKREAADKKAKNETKKQQKNKISKLRAETGTEGGTLVDFAKGHRGNLLNIGFSAVGAISEYKEGRKEGKTVLGASADAALSFAVNEVIGLKGAIIIGAAKGVATLGVKGTKYAIESSRSMNNIQRFTPFADAQFQDTQQLATMRQSGMELAKMSQYNLQQTLMGTEARYLHR